jgi:alpha-D-ribose 1-methylphosphonate 5-triphosphate synthase subunit PhnL
LSLARLVAIPRPVWLLDEPSSALDAPAQATLLSLMREHLGEGRNDRRRDACRDRDRGHSRIADRTGGMKALTALFLRDLRIAIHAGGGALSPFSSF